MRRLAARRGSTARKKKPRRSGASLTRGCKAESPRDPGAFGAVVAQKNGCARPVLHDRALWGADRRFGHDTASTRGKHSTARLLDHLVGETNCQSGSKK